MSVLRGFAAWRPICWAWAGIMLAAFLLAGCKSRFIATTIVNDTDHPLQMVELDYPGASFGVSTLAAHGVYSYRFKAIGSGALALSYSETTGVARSSAGPHVNDGEGGRLAVHIHERGIVSWEPVLGGR